MARDTRAAVRRRMPGLYGCVTPRHRPSASGDGVTMQAPAVDRPGRRLPHAHRLKLFLIAHHSQPEWGREFSRAQHGPSRKFLRFMRTHQVRSFVVVACLAAAMRVSGQTPAPKQLAEKPPASAPRAVAPAGFSAERLARMDKWLQQYVDEGRLGGAVALILRDGKPVYERAFGWRDKEAGSRMTADTIFRIASQTKALTSASILALMEEGKLGVNDPVSRFIPAYAKTTVSTLKEDGTTEIVPARRQITLRDLLTHTAGISYGTQPHVAALYEAKGLGPAAGNGWYTADKEEPICETMERLGGLPFVSQPGEAYVYGYNTDILGCVVEKASGIPLDQFVKT